ncbi:MAG: ATP-binding cassette domain-containing protein [Anaerolineae bacterium]
MWPSWLKNRPDQASSSAESQISDDRLIQLRQVTKDYPTPAGPFRALKGIDLQIDRGEFVVVIGKSGSGKSTLINTVTGIDRPTSGEVMVCGTPIHRLAESDLATWRGKRLGVIFQFFQLLPTLTLVENVMLPMELARRGTMGEQRKRALALLDQVGMASQANRLPAAISGGQQQRVAIARALANDPDVIVADEPTGSLDSRTANAVFDLFENLVAHGKTILMVTHDRDLAGRASRIVLIADGEIMDEELHHALPMLSRKEQVTLASHLESAIYRPGEVIVRQGDRADQFYVLLKGDADVILEDGSGGRKVIDHLVAGQFFGEIALLQGSVRTATVQAGQSDEVIVASLGLDEFNKLLDGSEPTKQEISRALRRRVAKLAGTQQT